LGNFTSDLGFDEVMRGTGAGNDLERALVREIQGTPAGAPAPPLGSVLDLQSDFGGAEVFRDGFISVAATNGAHIRVSEAVGQTTTVTQGACGASGCADGFQRDVPGVSVLGFADAAGFAGGEWAIIGRTVTSASPPAPRSFTIDLSGSGSSDIEALFTGANGTLRRLRLSNVDLSGGGVVAHVAGDGAVSFSGAEPTELAAFDRSAGPRIEGVRQVPEADERSCRAIGRHHGQCQR
jgi:hypothetical protein